MKNWISEEKFHQIYKDTEHFCWMDYMRLGVPCGSGRIPERVVPWTNCPYIDSFYINTTDKRWAPPVAEKWVRVKIRKMESNLNLYCIHCSGNDDTSYSFHIIGDDEVLEEIVWLQSQKDLTINLLRKRGYFFSN